MKIDLVIIDEEAYFSILINEQLFDTSKKISKLLNLDIDLYNKILIEKVIKYNSYFTGYSILEPTKSKDLVFSLNNPPTEKTLIKQSKETYITRFKETFTNQLTLLSLGGA